ncbi:family 20 glycosylhydrolase [Arthrobacter glacialis]|uniref:family 20 glycosylhydrolase n=1 Tax=Arthrobacter glacialis TaxID=1664 RepID=UPI000CD3C339|nr:family 20 glycosylhydrolase [Arthrobacter glacialis]POH58513.1 beta-N-acetylhexosaminidase [Arthrobacter glacialis]
MKALRRTTTAGLACAAALGLFAAVLPTAFTAPQAQAAPIVVPAPAPAASPINIARTGTATAHIVEAAIPGNVAANALDGNTGTRWSSSAGDAGWFQVELAASGPVDNVRINWPAGAARQFTLQTSADGITWTDVKSVTSTTGPARIDEILVGAANVKYVRVMLAKQWATFGYSISEFEIYDKPQPVVPENLSLVPLPVASAVTAAGTFRLTPSSRIIASGAAVDAANYFAQKARKSTGFALPVVAGTATAADVSFTVAPDSSEAKPESYTIQADANGVKVAANTSAGALNGVQTLRQLFPQWIESDIVVNTPWTVGGAVISDYPRYEHRGIQIDVARSFYTVDEMKEHIDNAAQFKYNKLHLHLTDDQGWRIAIDQPAASPAGIKYTDLTDISGKTAMTYNDAGVLQGTELGHTGFYTKADYKEIVRYAGENGMVVVPEIDMPGHTTAALHAIPQLNSAGSAPKPLAGQTTAPFQGSGNVGASTFDADSAATYEFTKEVLTQIAAMTPGPYLHIGGDESHSTPINKYKAMIEAFAAQVKDLNKQVIGWNEYSQATLPAGAVVQYWAGNRQDVANRVIANNSKVILSPAEKTYIPQKQDASQTAGGTWACGGGGCTLQNHYDWDPGTYLPGVGDDRVLGVETVQWGEWIRGMDQTETYQYPRTLATAEVAWSPQASRKYTDFSKRASTLGGRMALQDLTHFKTAGINWSTAPAAPAAKPAIVDPATLPATSPVNLAVPGTELNGGEYLTLKNLPADTWLLATVHGAGINPRTVSGEWVRSNAAGEAPFVIPTGLAAGAHIVSVQGATGTLTGFGSVAIAAVVPPTTAPATTAPATTAPATTAPATTAPATTVPATTAPATPSASVTPSATPSATQSASAPAGGIGLSADSVFAGGKLTITGKGFKPGTSASFTLHSTPVNLGTATVDAQGVVSLSVSLPADVAAGQHSIVIDGVGVDGQARQLSAALTITAAAVTPTTTQGTAATTTPAEDDLANTGANATVFGGLAVLLLLAGGTVFAVNRRRTASH